MMKVFSTFPSLVFTSPPANTDDEIQVAYKNKLKTEIFEFIWCDFIFIKPVKSSRLNASFSEKDLSKLVSWLAFFIWEKFRF